ncbi:hypothetical protein BC827DRAFT_1223234 [Russula dissimulans]|nr:hypothetical protein BC827DRAFT_1223234 [Russula dissimulans]
MRQSSASATPSAVTATAFVRPQNPRNPRPPRTYSDNSTPSIPASCFWTNDFLLGASMVIIQPSSGKVVLVNDTARATWFLPRGRKDIGETLEQCALREAYEESGYRVEFLPLHLPTRAPVPPGQPRHDLSVFEPVFVTTTDFGPYHRYGQADTGGQYLTFYYVGQIPADAVRVIRERLPVLLIFQSYWPSK